MHLEKVSSHFLRKKCLRKNGQKKKKEKNRSPPKNRSKIIAEKEKSINSELFREYFKYQNPSYMFENLYSTKNKERNKIQVNLIKSALTDLKNKIKNMSDNEKRIEQPDKKVDSWF